MQRRASRGPRMTRINTDEMSTPPSRIAFCAVAASSNPKRHAISNLVRNLIASARSDLSMRFTNVQEARKVLLMNERLAVPQEWALDKRHRAAPRLKQYGSPITWAHWAVCPSAVERSAAAMPFLVASIRQCGDD